MWIIYNILFGCYDLDKQKTDRNGNGCKYYTMKPSECGKYDDADFNAKQLCCGCKTGIILY